MSLYQGGQRSGNQGKVREFQNEGKKSWKSQGISEKPEISGKSQGILSNQSLQNFNSNEISSMSKILRIRFIDWIGDVVLAFLTLWL